MRSEVLLDINKKSKLAVVVILDPLDSYYRSIGKAIPLPKSKEVTVVSWKENRDKLLTPPLRKAV